MELDTTPTAENQLGICVGIDLGTTNSCVAFYDGAAVTVCANEFGKRTTPSYVAFTNNERLVGQAAVRQQAKNPWNTIYESKRFIGRAFTDCNEEESAHYPFQLIDLGENNVNFVVEYHGENRIFCPEEIAAIILDKMASIASDATGLPVTKAVVTVPAYFNDAQRQATIDAGRIAGLEVLRIINEPTAAAIAYGLDNPTENGQDSNILVFDIGGGTIDTSLLTVTSDGVFEVLAIAGDTRLGGADFDQRLMDMVVDRYRKEFSGNELNLNDAKIHRRVRQACERAKCELSGVQVTDIELAGLGPNGEDFETSISRGQFDDACQDLYDRCMALVRQTLQDAHLTIGDVDEVVLVGGSTRIPRLQELLSGEFGGKELCKSINPDEAVAHGAAIQAAILHAADTNQDIDCDVVLLDVCPLSLGLETKDGLMSVIIPRNTMIPVKKSRVYSTTDDNQAEVTVQVYEGERSNTADNRLLGSFELGGLQPAPRGAPKIRVTFELDADGIFRVTAKDESEVRLETERGEDDPVASHTLTIQNNKGRLSEEEVKRIVKDAEELEKQDAIFRRTVKARTEYENLLYGVRRTFSDNGTLKENADESDIQCVLDIVASEFEWLETQEGGQAKPSDELVTELHRRRDWLEMEIARPMVDAVNLKVQS